MQHQNGVLNQFCTKTDLLDATALVEQDGSQQNIAELERVLEATRRSSEVPASLKVRAKKLLLGQGRKVQRKTHAESVLRDAFARLQRVHASEPDPHNRSRSTALRRLREDRLLQELSLSLEKAMLMGVSPSLIEKGRALAESVIAERREDEFAAHQLQQLLRVEGSPGDVEAELHVTCNACELTGDGAQMALSKVRKHMRQLEARRQQQQALNAKVALAKTAPDKSTVRELVHVAMTLDLALPPDLVPLLHSLEATSQHGTNRSSSPLRTGGDEFAARQLQVAEKLCEMAEQAVTEDNDRLIGDIHAARQAMLRAKQAGISGEILIGLERRITELERQQVPKLRCEGELGRLVRLGHEVVHDAASVEGLRTVLDEARRVQADERLVALGSELLERSSVTVEAKRKGEVSLMWALSRPLRTDDDVEVLRGAIEEARNLGICTLQAQRKLLGALQLQQLRRAAEVELEEASTLQNRARFEDAFRAAKSIGVSGKKLRVANAHLTDLTHHDKKCAAMAANIQRAISSQQTHPWKLQLTLREVQPLHPKTQELDRLIRQGEQLLEKSLTAHATRIEAQVNLEELIEEILSDCVDSPDPVPELETRIKQASKLGVDGDSLLVAEQLLQSLRCQPPRPPTAQAFVRSRPSSSASWREEDPPSGTEIDQTDTSKTLHLVRERAQERQRQLSKESLRSRRRETSRMSMKKSPQVAEQSRTAESTLQPMMKDKLSLRQLTRLKGTSVG